LLKGDQDGIKHTVLMDALFFSRVPLSSRRRVYCILVSVSLLLLVISSRQVWPVSVEVEAPLGLASNLAPGYWAGLAILLLTSILAYLDRELKSDAIYFVILVALGFYLLGIRVFVEENAVDATAYYPTSVVKNLLEAGRLDIPNPPNIVAYYSWPGIHFISAFLMKIPGLDLIPLLKYSPLCWVFCFVFITYAIGKRLNFLPANCFAVSFISIVAWLVSVVGYYYARFPAMLFLLLLFINLVNPKRHAPEVFVNVLLFSALVITHGMTSVAVLPGLVLVSIYKKEYVYLPIFIFILAAWLVYQGSPALESGISAFTVPLRNIFELSQGERYQTAASAARLTSRYTELFVVTIYVVCFLCSLLLLLRRKIPEERSKQVIAAVLWVIGVSLIILWGHGEAFFRTLIFVVVPASVIFVLAFIDRKLIVLLMSILLAVSPFYSYSGLSGWGLVSSEELRGSEYLALKVNPRDGYFYNPGGQLPLFYNPDMINTPRVDPVCFASTPNDVDLSVLDRIHLIVLNKHSADSRIFSWSEDPYSLWPETSSGKKADLIYNNPEFLIYKNNSVK